jgi:hypothetical protein
LFPVYKKCLPHSRTAAAGIWAEEAMLQLHNDGTMCGCHTHDRPTFIANVTVVDLAFAADVQEDNGPLAAAAAAAAVVVTQVDLVALEQQVKDNKFI